VLTFAQTTSAVNGTDKGSTQATKSYECKGDHRVRCDVTAVGCAHAQPAAAKHPAQGVDATSPGRHASAVRSQRIRGSSPGGAGR
jgi:hypothetical protein